jgi:PAS domain S-box-containing protein
MTESETPEGSPGHQRLCDFIRDHRARILEEWTREARLLPGMETLPPTQFLDNFPPLLDRLANLVETVHTGEHLTLEELPEAHALNRLDAGVDLEQVASEYALLRACILRLYSEGVGERSSVELAREMARFNQAFDTAIVIAVARYARTRERTLVALDRLSEAALGTEALDTFLPKLLRVILESTEPVDSLALLLCDGDTLRMRAAVGLEADVTAGFSLKVGEGFAGMIASERRPRELRSAFTDPLVKSPALRARGIQALYGVPLLHGEQVIGVAHMGSRTAFEFSNEDKLLFRVMVSRATGLIVQAQLAARERKARQEAQRALARLNLLMDTAPVGFGFWDTQLRYVLLNERLAEMNGVPVAEHLGRTVREVLPRLAPTLEPLYRQVLETGQSLVDLEVKGETPSAPGQTRYWQVSYYPVRDVDGAILGLGGVVLETTDRKRAEEQLRTVEFRERFLGIVSHDLRNPLNAIRLSASALLRSDDLAEHPLKAVRRIATSSERMGRMISDLLDFTRGRLGGGIPIQPRSANLHTLCEQVVEELEVGHPERELRLTAEGNFEGEWDPDRLAQVLGNLGKNALAYSPPETPVDFVLRDEGDAVSVEVHNEGAPIAREWLPYVFEPFKRATEKAHDVTPGLGLGLYIVQEVVAAHGGTVKVRSTEAEGTTFTVRLPRRSARPP